MTSELIALVCMTSELTAVTCMASELIAHTQSIMRSEYMITDFIALAPSTMRIKIMISVGTSVHTGSKERMIMEVVVFDDLAVFAGTLANASSKSSRVS